MKLIKTIIYTAIISFFSACEKDELPVLKHNSGDREVNMASMDANYKWQIYFDLKTNTVVGQNLKTAWDLGFEATSTGYRITLNSSKSMFAENTNDTNFSAVIDTNGFSKNKTWDSPSGNLDSTALGDWRGNKNVYIIDRGYGETGFHQGFRKIQFIASSDKKYVIHFSELNGNGEKIFEVVKDSLYNFTFLSFSNGGETVQIEPPKKDWDLEFTQYTHVFYDPFTTYLVTGCLLNRCQTEAVRDPATDFLTIEFDHVNQHPFSANINVIGYDWKSFTGSSYITHPEMNYLIKDREGFFYKLHFIDFYSSSGVKGTPKWEYQEL